ncbi:hypothetical protein, partial [Rheinheimera baltica]|uniref:hypothetical protein n=1 Tax=Rheinheimera baltica TaxID=67576 RepID=UPI00273F253D
LVVTADVADIDVPAFYQQYNRFGIAVTSESFFKKHALVDHYLPIETPYYLLFDSNMPPQSEWLDRAQLHLSYVEKYPISLFGKEQYQLQEVPADTVFLGHAKDFTAMYQSVMAGRAQLAYKV